MAAMLNANTVLRSGYLTPREKMMLAKMAIIEDEARETGERRERRKSRRASSMAQSWEGSSVPASMTSPPSKNLKQSQSSILRPNLPSPSPSSSSNSMGTANATAYFSPTSAPTVLLPVAPEIPLPTKPIPLGPKEQTPMTWEEKRSLRRRSSRVRFADDEPGSSTKPTESVPAEPVEGGRRSSIAPRSSFSTRVPVPRLSVVSYTSGQSDPFDLQLSPMSSRPSFAMSITSEADDADDARKAFLPKPLTYPKVSKALARLSAEMEASPAGWDLKESQSPASPTSSIVSSRSTSAPIPITASGGSRPMARSSSSAASPGFMARSPSSWSRASYASTSVSRTGGTAMSSSVSSSISLDIPNRHELIAALLPKPLVPVAEELAPRPPCINRSGWMDGDAGISPKSSPSALLSDGASMEDPRVSTHPIITQPVYYRRDSREISPKTVPTRFFEPALSEMTLSSPSILPQPTMLPASPVSTIEEESASPVVQPPSPIPTLESQTLPSSSLPTSRGTSPTPPVRPPRSPQRFTPSPVPTVEEEDDIIAFLPVPDTREAETNLHTRTISDLAFTNVLDFPVPPERCNSLEYTLSHESTKLMERLLGDDVPVSTTSSELKTPVQETESIFTDDFKIECPEVVVEDCEAKAESPVMALEIDPLEATVAENKVVEASASPLQVTVETMLQQPEIEVVEASEPTVAFGKDGAEVIADEAVVLSGYVTPVQVDISTFSDDSEIASRSGSPDISEVLDNARRNSPLLGDAFDSDLEVKTPLVEVALKTNILSPNSRLLNATTPPAVQSLHRQNSGLTRLSLRTGRSFTSGKGWSGSESEEEAWSLTLREVARRRVSASISKMRSSSASASSASIIRLKSFEAEPLAMETLMAPTESVVAALNANNDASPISKKTLKRASRLDSRQFVSTHSEAFLPTSVPMLPRVRPSLRHNNENGRESTYSALSTQSSTSSSTVSSTTSEQVVTPNGEFQGGFHSPAAHLIAETKKPRPVSASSIASPPGDFPWGRSASPSQATIIKTPPKQMVDSNRRGSSLSRSRSLMSPLSPLTQSISKGQSIEQSLASWSTAQLSPVSPPLSPAATLISPPSRSSSRMPLPTTNAEEWGALELMSTSDNKYTRYDKPSKIRNRISLPVKTRPALINSSSWSGCSTSQTFGVGFSGSYTESLPSSPTSPSRATCHYVPTSKKVTSPRKAVPSHVVGTVDETPQLGNGWRVPSPMFGVGVEEDEYVLDEEMLSMVRA